MIYVTGDTHGNCDGSAKKLLHLKEYAKSGDYLIICGDFGFVWEATGCARIELNAWLNKMSKFPYTVLFIDGNHENFELLNALKVDEWHGGKVHFINDNVIHLMRGQIFEIENQKIFTFGGAESIDRNRRVLGVSWWQEEMPSGREYLDGLDKLQEYNNEVDYIITHDAPISLVKNFYTYTRTNNLNEYFEDIKNSCKFKHWYYGHHHTDCTDGKLTCLYNGVTELGKTDLISFKNI